MKHGTSGVVAIPMAYRRYHKIDTGDEVKIIYNGLLIIIPRGMEHVLKQKRALIEKILES
jgi:bifunctional DNA-binding transcriptional regulator/antitoxin component of YhaV-PrlF toxin-antitoxin module